jgi:hypothetical protein
MAHLTAVHLMVLISLRKVSVKVKPWWKKAILSCTKMYVGAGWVMVCMTTWAYIPNKIKTDVDEASDTLIDWLVKNTDQQWNVGNLGNIIPGFMLTYSLLSRHPALKAVSPQACISDFSLMIFTITEPIYWAIGSHAAFGIQRRNAPPVLGTKFPLETKDDYQFFMNRTFV